MLLVIAYLSTLLIFVGIDMVWLTWVGGPVYRSLLGDILLPTVRMAPAFVFYLIYPVGLVLYAVQPNLTSGSLLAAAIAGALFGFFTYATYDLTNFATLRNWPLTVTLMDIGWGMVLGAVAAAAATLVTGTLASWLGVTGH
jgi:uncharacterized membrane protein